MTGNLPPKPANQVDRETGRGGPTTTRRSHATLLAGRAEKQILITANLKIPHTLLKNEKAKEQPLICQIGSRRGTIAMAGGGRLAFLSPPMATF